MVFCDWFKALVKLSHNILLHGPIRSGMHSILTTSVRTGRGTQVSFKKLVAGRQIPAVAGATCCGSIALERMKTV